LGDDDLLMPGMIRRILDTIQANREIESFYLNYGIARFPDDWPADCIGGFTGKLRKLHIDAVQDRLVRCWKEFIHPNTDLCTEMFCQIVRRDIWVDYWSCRPVDPPSANTTAAVFPHSMMWAATIMNKPSYFIGDPVSVCFYGSQWYIEARAEIFALNYTSLFRLYHRAGLSGDHLKECERGVFSFCELSLSQLLSDPASPPRCTIARFLAVGWCYPTAWKVLARAIRRANRPWVASKLLGGIGKVNKLIGFFDPWKTITDHPCPGQSNRNETVTAQTR
jgi:hypothetical protein